MKCFFCLLFSAAMAVSTRAEGPLLSLGFDYERIGAQSWGLPEAEAEGVRLLGGTPGIAEFGAAGSLRIPGFTQPVGPFTMEARFRLHDYGVDPGSHVSVLLSTLVGNQGFAFHVGGGPGYPILDRMGAPQASQFFATSLDSTPDNRALVGSCVGAATLAAPGGGLIQAFTRSCVQLGEWNHLAATWDGAHLRIYLNGLEDTDTLRMPGKGLAPAPADAAPLHVGYAGYAGAMGQGPGPRHFDGDMDFIRVIGGAKKALDILAESGSMSSGQDDGFDCQGSVTPIGALVQGGCDAGFSKIGLGDRDSMEVQFSRTWDFRSVFLSYRIPVKFFRYSDHHGRGGLDESARTYWRTRVVAYQAPQLPTRALSRDGTGALLPMRSGTGEGLMPYRVDGSRLPARAGIAAGFRVPGPLR